MQKFFPQNVNETLDNYNLRYDNFIHSIKDNYTYAGDFEISSASIILRIKIIIYTYNLVSYKLLNEYNLDNNIKEVIYIVYRNNNHFNLLNYKKDLGKDYK